MNKQMQQAGNIDRRKTTESVWVPRKTEICEMYRTMSMKDIAIRYGVSTTGIQKVMKRLGIKPKPKWRVGKENGRYKHGLASTLYRKMIEKKACVACGTTANLCVHHINGDHYDNRPSNLEVQCMSCHSSRHKQAWWNARRGQ